MDEWHVDKGIDLSLTLTVLGCAMTVFWAIVHGWMKSNDRAHDMESQQEILKQELNIIKNMHDRDRDNLNRAFSEFTNRIEAEINRLYEKLDGKADK